MYQYSLDSDSSPDNALNLNERSLRVAFAFEGSGDSKLKIDPQYVRLIFRIVGKKDDKWSEHILPHHECTEEDFAEFYPIDPSHELTLQAIKEDSDRAFLCTEWDDSDPYLLYQKEYQLDY